ncbi:unnamed protein product [Eruca vesicaria subsp. sativa]|uniref:PGG domain-containing protein n=1 Tax=Eruca vesicaria subsp. sativa TaxID=29727 RepID=A0ABC8LNK2_ERUVS|nr:unnamed protein product [Eruca vesicaria subsp. sativa]
MSIVVDVNRFKNVTSQGPNMNGISSTSTHGENNIEKLKKAAQDGDVERLYELIAEDPNILGHFDKVPFCETPLHIAAEKGQTHFAMELMTLKPSLASKLNVAGYSPMHLALQNNHRRMVRGFVAIHSSLVSVKGRGRVTPLHHVAQIGDAELLSEFLFACPSSIEDLTIKCETAVHVAVKHGKFMAFNVLLGWLKRVKKEEILDWKNEDGNTVFHIAAMINHTEVMKLLRKTVKVEAKNLDGKTAMDILQPDQSRLPITRRIINWVKDRTGYGSTTTLAVYLSSKLSIMERRNNLLGLSNLNLTRKTSPNTSERRDALLVVAILKATATYQAGLSPPGGFWQENSSKPSDGNGHRAGQMTMEFKNAFVFIVLNGLAFLSSLFVIIMPVVFEFGRLEYQNGKNNLSVAQFALYQKALSFLFALFVISLLPKGIRNLYIRTMDVLF